MIIATVLLLNNSRFNSSIILRSFAYEVGLSIRQAQLYGISVKEVGVGGSLPNTANFNYPYGIHFDPATPSSYLLFADANDDGKYSPGVDTAVTTFVTRNGYTISDIAAKDGSGFTWSYSSASKHITSLDISFKRPDPSAIIEPTGSGLPSSFTSASITVSSPAGSTRSVNVSDLGQISIIATGS